MAREYVLSERDYNRMQNALRWVERNKNPRELLRRRNITIGGGGGISKIFEIQSAGTGDGIYICYEYEVEGDNWDDATGKNKLAEKNIVEIEVLNLFENDPVFPSTEALAPKDKIKAWQVTDNDGNTKWVGIALSHSLVRRAIISTNPPSPEATYLSANLYDNENNVITKGLGSNITVYFEPSGARAYLHVGDSIWVVNVQGKWYLMKLLVGGDCHLAFCAQSAPHSNTISCHLDEEEGTLINVICNIHGPTTYLDEAIPRLQSGKKILVAEINDLWYCTGLFQASCICTNCECIVG